MLPLTCHDVSGVSYILVSPAHAIRGMGLTYAWQKSSNGLLELIAVARM